VLRLVELQQGCDWGLGDLLKLSDGLVHPVAHGGLHTSGCARDDVELLTGKPARIGDRHDGVRGAATGNPLKRIQVCNQLLEVAGQRGSARAGADENTVELGLLFRYGVSGVGQSPQGARRDGCRVDHGGELSPERLGCRHDATEHVLELATLLQEDRHRALAALQGDEDVGDLSRRAAERGGLLGGADAILVQFGAGLLCRGLAGRQLLHDLVQDRATGAQ